MLADFGKATFSSLLAILATCSGKSVWWKKADPIVMVAIRNFHVECGHCTVKQTYENVLNGVVEVTKGLLFSLAVPNIAVRIIEDIASCGGKTLKSTLG
jgi:hypothetical protein